MIIELCGLPASGKSTLAKKLQTEVNFTIIKKITKPELFFYNILFVIKYPIFFSQTLFYILKSKKLIYMKVMNVLFHHNAAYQKAKKTKGNVVLPEGHHQNLYSIFEKEIENNKLQKYISQIPAVDKVIVFDLPEKVIKERSEKRGYFARHDILNKKSAEEWKHFILKQNKKYIKLLSTQPKTQVIRSKKEEEKLEIRN